MDPFSALGVAASIIACIQLSQSLLKKLGPSAHKSQDLKLILRTMMQFRKAYETLKEFAELDESEEIRLTTFKQVEEPLKECKDIIDTVVERLEKNSFLKQWVTGSAWDRKLQKCMSRLNEVRTLLDIAMQSDQLWFSLVDQVKEEKRRALLQWLFNTDPNTNHQAARKACMRGTGEWLLQSLEYRRWKENPRSFLWLQGLPGAGKTVLCSTVVEDVQEFCSSNSSHLVAFYYFSFSDSQKQTTTNFLRSILAQMIKQSNKAFHTAAPLYDDTDDPEPQLDALKVMLRAMIAAHGCVFIVADALDECPGVTAAEDERQLVSETLEEIISWQLDSLHLMITSRKIADLESMIDVIPGVVTVLIQNDRVDADTRLYVASELQKDKKLRSWPPGIRTEIETTLAEGAKGMFRWVSCQLEMLRRCITPAQVRRCLKTLPKTLYSTYERMLAEIDKEYIDMAITALKWLVIAQRPLALSELAEAVALGLEPRADFDIDNRLPDLTDILRILGSLIAVQVPDSDSDTYSDASFDAVTNTDSEYDSDSDTGSDVGLAHFSVREYLISTLPKPWSTNHFNEADLHDFATRACLNYIQFIKSQNLMFGDLYFYALYYWCKHAQKCKNHDRANSAELIALLSKFSVTGRSPLERLLPSQIVSDPVRKLLGDEYNFNVDETIQVEAYTPIQIESSLDSTLKLATKKGSACLLELLTVVLMAFPEGTTMKHFLADCTPIPDIDGQPWWTPFFEVLLPSKIDQSTRSLRTKFFEYPDWQPSILSRSGPNAGMNIAAAVAHQDSVEAVRQLSEIINGSLGRDLRLIGLILPWAVGSPIHPLEKLQILQAG
ncbi:ankyrin repeat protein [Rutstroemia sp. NJR-2017a BVV2]|nr:ankyrin repeat protein [Rutstroemia sp. NJR-2017a BVV2]